MKKLKKWIKERKDRSKLVRDLKAGRLDVAILDKMFRLIAANTIDPDDSYACKIGIVGSGCVQLKFGQSGGYSGQPELLVYIYLASSGSIRIECVYTVSKTNSYRESVTFNDVVGVNYIRDDKPNDYVNSMERIDTIKNVINSSMLYTLRNYIKRWYAL